MAQECAYNAIMPIVLEENEACLRSEYPKDDTPCFKQFLSPVRVF